MSNNGDKVLAQALELPPIERAELIEKLLSSFEFPSRKSIDEMWAKEVEDRIDAYERGEINAKSARDVFDGIGKEKT